MVGSEEIGLNHVVGPFDDFIIEAAVIDNSADFIDTYGAEALTIQGTDTYLDGRVELPDMPW